MSEQDWKQKIGGGLLDLGKFAVDTIASGISDPYKQNLMDLNAMTMEDERLKKNRAYMQQALGNVQQNQGLDSITQELLAEEGADPLQQFIQQQPSGYLGSERAQGDKLEFMGQMANSYMPGTRTAANAMMRDQMQPVDERAGAQFADKWLNLGDKYKNPATGEEFPIDRPPAPKYLDQGDQFVNPATGQVYQKNVQDTQVKKKAGNAKGDRIANFQTNLAADDKIISSMGETISMLDGLMEDTDYTNAGFAALTQEYPMFPAMDWAQKKETIVSRLALDKMMELKAASPTGSTGFGALSERELDVLQKELGSLKQAQSPSAIKTQIQKIQRLLRQSIEGTKNRRRVEGGWYNRNIHGTDMEPWKQGGAKPAAPAEQQQAPKRIRYSDL